MLHLVHSDDSRPVTHAHQRDVDSIQATIRAEGKAARPPLFKPAPPRPGPSKIQLDHRIAEEIEAITRRLEQLGGALAHDPILLQRYATQLQSIDLIEQLLRHLSEVVAAEDKDEAVDLITLSELKARLQRKPLARIQA